MLFLSACSEIEQDEMFLPDVEQLTPETINSDLQIVNIITNQWAFDALHVSFSPVTKIDAKINIYDKYFEPQIENKSVKIEIKGSSSRVYDLKSLGITFDTTLNNQVANIITDAHLNPSHSLDSLKTIRLRNSGQDFQGTMIKDMAYTQFAIKLGLNFEVMYGNAAAHVFVNDSYLGILNLRTESNIVGISRLLNEDESNMVIYKVDPKNQNIEHQQGDIGITVNLEEAIDHASPKELHELIDVSSFIDYLIFQDYIGNDDWPHNNIRMHNIGEHGFRFIVYDLDWAGELTKNAKIPELEYLNYDLAKIYQKLMQVDGFKEQLNERQETLYEKFKVEDFYAIVDQLAKNIEDDIIYQIAKYEEPISLYQWKQDLSKLKRDFERRDHHIRKKYKLND